MANKRTRKQKRQAEKRRKQASVVSLDKSEKAVVSLQEKKSENKSTKMNKSQVSLVYKDLLKTAVVSLIVFILLLFIFVYMR